MQVDKEVEEIIMKKSQKWLEAAKKCDNRNNKERISKVAEEMQDFLDSDHGKIALHGLLRASNRHVLFAKNNRHHPDIAEEVFILTNAGPLCVQNILIGDLIVPRATPMALVDFISATVRYTGKQPELLLLFLLNELGKISESITP